MEFKVGDTIKVRSDLVVDKRYGCDSFVYPMKHLRGEQVTIKKVYVGKYTIEEDGGNWFWTDEMLEPVEEKFNILDMVEVGDLLEINEMSGIYYVDSIILEDGLKVFTCDQKYGYRFVFNEMEVKAIYKRQSNGDYKRYEVENNE